MTKLSAAESSKSADVDTGFTNIWSRILQDVQNSTKKSPPPKSVVLLGDNESGRSTLVARLKGVESISKGIGLEYHYIDIKDEDRDDIPKLGIWIPDGDGACSSLLKFALNETNIEHTLVAFVVSMSTPWTIMDSLHKWASILRDHIKKLNLSESQRKELQRQQMRAFQTYQDPDEQLTLKKTTTTVASAASKTRHGSSAANADALDSLDTTADGADDDLLLPLDPSILSKNLGIKVLVIVTKSDCISVLDKEMEYRIEHFDFIQYHIRRFCLEYGAGLLYTTIKDKRTNERLYRYLTSKLYSHAFNYPASVVDRESIFIPSGWDNDGKINILLENSTTIKSDSDYNEIIGKPALRKPMQRDVETVMAMDDQEFLSKLQTVLNKMATPTIKPEDASQQQMSAPNTTTPIMKTPHKTAPLKPSANGADSTNLKNFFQNLLNKNTSASSASTMTQPTSDAAAASQAATPTTPSASIKQEHTG